MNVKKVVVFIGFLLPLVQVHAELTVAQYKEMVNRPDKILSVKAYISEVYEVLDNTNNSLVIAGNPPAFCISKKLIMDETTVQSILEKQISVMTKKKMNILEHNVPIILQLGLMETFPCKNKQKS